MAIRLKPEPYCPKCGGKMTLRKPNAHQYWDAFWGCSNYPECKGTINIDMVTGKPIEDDDECDYFDDRPDLED